MTPRQCDTVVKLMNAMLKTTSVPVECGFLLLLRSMASSAECAVKVTIANIFPNLALR